MTTMGQRIFNIVFSLIVATIILLLNNGITKGEFFLLITGLNCLYELWDINNKLSGNDTHRLIK